MLFKTLHKIKMVVIITTIFFISRPLSAHSMLHNQSGIWVVRHNLYSKQAIDETISKIVELGSKTIYLQVRGRGYSLYDSALEPKSPNIKEDFDPLTYFISRAKPYGLEIHAWINTYLLWTAPDDPVSKLHVYHQHPDWFERAIKKSPYYKTRNIYLSPHLTAVNDFLLSMIEELVSNYNLEGVHLDYVRYLDKYNGYHEKAVEQFYSIYALPKENLADNKFWIDFRSLKVTGLVESVYDRIKAINPEVKLSTAVKPNPQVARKEFGQDWQAWLGNGIVDYVVIMNYAKNHYDFIQNLNIINRACDSEKVYCGIALYNKNMDAIIDQIKSAKKLGFPNIVLFSYDSIIENNWLKKGG